MFGPGRTLNFSSSVKKGLADQSEVGQEAISGQKEGPKLNLKLFIYKTIGV